MMDRVVLEEIKEKVKYLQGDLLNDELNWLIKQAERVQELEEDLRLSEAEEYSRGKQNKRYRDSIKKAISYFNYDEHQRGMAELQKALEESQ